MYCFRHQTKKRKYSDSPQGSVSPGLMNSMGAAHLIPGTPGGLGPAGIAGLPNINNIKQEPGKSHT